MTFPIPESPFKLINGDQPGQKCIEFKNGDTLMLPLRWKYEEFVLPGNCVEMFDGKFIVCYDEESRTGAIWTSFPRGHWIMLTPFGRDEFFKQMVPRFVGSALSSPLAPQ